MKQDVFYPAVLWTAAIALCDLIFYPLIIPAPSPICGVPAHPAGYSADHFGRVLILFFVFLAVGLVAFGLARLARQRWIGPAVLAVVCAVLGFLSFDHDYPACNTLSPRQSTLLTLATLLLPTALIWVYWRFAGRRSSVD